MLLRRSPFNNIQKIKVTYNEDPDMIIGNIQLEHANDYIYLGHKKKLGRENQTFKINRKKRTLH